MLRRPRPRPRGLQSPRSAALHFVQQTSSAQRNKLAPRRAPFYISYPLSNLPALTSYTSSNLSLKSWL